MANETTGNYIFRIHNDGASNIRLECWGRSAKLDSNKIKTIGDTLRKGASKAATSVPSPFARMYQFDTAFKMVSEDLEGDSMYHQLVSDCLDIFQLLFNFGNSNTDLRFKQWNRQERIEKLKANPESHPHRLLADSLELFFTNDFADIQDITLIYYKDILLGGTSPFTIFFTSANWYREMAENNIVIGSTTKNALFFGGGYRALHERDDFFIEFIWKYYLAHRTILNQRCLGLATYIRNSIEKHKNVMFRKINGDLADYINKPARIESEFERVTVIPNSNTYLQINNIFTYTVKTGSLPEKIQNESDFLIVPSIDNYKHELDDAGNRTNPLKPLVLVKGMNISGTYTYDNTPWNPNTDIRQSSIVNTLFQPLLLSERYLPGNSQLKYPFITTEDFFEDSLIKMPFKLNTGKFFTGYPGDFNYLLPIKKEYFNFFTKEDLQKNLEIIPSENKITVKLKIPIRNKRGNPFITLTKDYEFANTPVALCKAGLAVFPFYRIRDNDENLQKLNEYNVLFAEKNDKLKIEAVNFWKCDVVKQSDNGIALNKDGNIAFKVPLAVDKPEPRTKKGIFAASYYYKVTSAFDLIEIKISDDTNKNHFGIIIPKFKEVYNQQATKKYTFAIDFGTSNSHIAYTDQPDDKKPKTFEIGENDLQMVLLNKPGEAKILAEKYTGGTAGFGDFPDIDAYVNREFVPAIIGKDFGSNVAFPVRTTTCEKNTFEAESPDLFLNINPGFFIDSDVTKAENCIYKTNLKWLFENSKNASDPDRIEAFLKGLLLLIRNKVITNGGTIEDTKIVWLIPLSMQQRSIDLFAKIWQKTFDAVFKSACNNLLEPITESVAPYFYLKSNHDANVKDFADALNIDIGGGTTDVMFFMRKTDIYLSSSFRFAGNDIWGDGFNRNEKDNGFLQNFKEVRSRSKQNSTKEDIILAKFMNDGALTSEDVTSLLFRYNEHFKFSDSIERDKPALKLVCFLHYSAIIYHVIQIIIEKQLSIPRYITFTGKGSQYINIMCSKDMLTKFTKILISTYSSLTMPDDFRVVLTPSPKEATANGAVLFINSPDKDRISKDNIDIVYHWGNESTFSTTFKRNSTRIKEVVANTDFNFSVLSNLQKFIEKTLFSENVIAFLRGYSINHVEDYAFFLTKGDATKSGELHDSYYSLLESMKVNPDDSISETFFFLALKDSLYKLSKFIVESKFN